MISERYQMKARFKSFPLMSVFLAMDAMAWLPLPLECNNCRKKKLQRVFLLLRKNQTYE
jgi:hypothetical protein